MKKYILGVIAVLTIGTTFSQILFKSKKHRQEIKSVFTVKDEIVFYNNNPIARYQAKTYSLDNGELVEEYNLLLLDNKIQNKQIIGDLIDYISDRHQNAEVEVEIDAKGSVFNL